MFRWRCQTQQFGVAFTDVQAGNLALNVGGDVGGDGAAVSANRARLETALDVDAGSLQFMHQIHSATAVVLDQPRAAGRTADLGQVPDADALVCPGGSVALAVLAADCMPIVLAGTSKPDNAGALLSTAVVHAGRRGLLAGVIAEAVTKMRALGPQEISAWIGPSICGNCYEVPEAMAAEAAAIMPATESRTRWGTAGIDLRAGAVAQLSDLGVQAQLITGCTFEDNGLFSHRSQPGAGRIAGVVWRTGGIRHES